MKLRAKQVKEVDVDIDDREIVLSTVRLLSSMYNVSDCWVDKDGWICCDDDWGHGTPSTKKLREATEREIAVLRAIDLLKNEFKIY